MDWQATRSNFHVVDKSLTPLNLIKGISRSLTFSRNKNNLLNNGIGLGTGLVSKRILTGNSLSFLKELLETVVQSGTTNIISKHSENLKSIGRNILKRLWK